jgi:hypothetical protein
MRWADSARRRLARFLVPEIDIACRKRRLESIAVTCGAAKGIARKIVAIYFSKPGNYLENATQSSCADWMGCSIGAFNTPAAGCDLCKKKTDLSLGKWFAFLRKRRTMTAQGACLEAISPAPRPDCSEDVSPATPTKSKPQTCREFERALREMGFSQREATAIASHGFKGRELPDPPEVMSELAALIQRNTTVLERIDRKHS